MSDLKLIYTRVIDKLRNEHETALESERNKWEFRYENQDRRIKELETTVREMAESEIGW
jgi:hypothetical protein